MTGPSHASPNSMLARRLAVSLAWAQENNPGAWWFAAASSCMQAGHFRLITSRDGNDAYMLRCWLTPPLPNTDKDDVRSQWESGNATLLHWILQPDDAPDLHDHPWDFQTKILWGGYHELFKSWVNAPDVIPFGCPILPGDLRDRHARDLHTIASLVEGPGNLASCGGGAWTLVTTGDRYRRWGFHPTGGAWQDASAYLKGAL